MPPNGLYPVPRHHLVGSSPYVPRPKYNTMDFGDDPDEPATDQGDHGKIEDMDEKTEKNSIKKPYSDGKDDDERDQPGVVSKTTAKPNMLDASAAMSKTSKKTKKEKTPDKMDSRAKKRKRESVAFTGALSAVYDEQSKDSSVLHPGFVDSIKKSMGDISAIFSWSSNASRVPQQPSLKKQKSQSHMGSYVQLQPPMYDKDGKPLPRKPGRPKGWKMALHGSDTAKAKHILDVAASAVASGRTEPKKDKHKNRHSLSVDGPASPSKTPVPLPPAKSSHSSTPKKTPVPLPQNSAQPHRATNTPQHKHDKTHRKASQLLTASTSPRNPSTPPALIDTPIPFALRPFSSHPNSPSTPPKKKKKKPKNKGKHKHKNKTKIENKS